MAAPTGPANLIKAQIKANLDALVTDTVLGAVIEEAQNTDVLKLEFPGYPCAVLGVSNMLSDWEYPQSNRRTYTYDILVVQLVDNLNNVANMEDLRDAIALKFDNDVTLAGTAMFGVSAAMSENIPVASEGKNFIVFNVTIRATTVIPLTYSF